MQTAATETSSMGRKKKGEGDATPTVAVKLDRVLVGRARIVATEHGTDLATYLSGLLMPLVTKDWRKVVESMDK